MDGDKLIGRLLRVDLSSKAIVVEDMPEEEYRKYMGGRALIGKLLLSELGPGTDPLGEENMLIFAPGVITGTPIAGTGRSAVGGKSPLTNGFGCSEGGGFFPAELRRTGYAGVVVTGKSDRPVCLVIDGDKASLLPVDDLWGQTVDETDKQLRVRLGSRFRVCTIGPAGEKLVRFASVHNDITHVAGRTGMGAVMGSKRLKAVAVRGQGPVPLADKAAVRKITESFAQRWESLAGGMRDTGTPGILLGLNKEGGLPTRGFQRGSFEHADDISGQKMRDTVLTGRHSCWACPINCKREVTVEGQFEARPEFGGPEYETLAALGSLCEVASLEAICCGNALCNAYGMDTISTGVVISFVMECWERGILGPQNSLGPEVTFGDAEGMINLIHMIAGREGFGDLLAEGVFRASGVIGRGAREVAMHVRGQELPMHEPRFKPGLGLGYAVSPTGADHCHNLHDAAYNVHGRALEVMAAFGILKPVPLESLGTDKLRLFRYGSGWRHFMDCAVLCYFVPWAPTEVVELIRGVTGWDTSLLELFDVSERSVNMARCFNVREGLGGEHDRLPDRIFEPIVGGRIDGRKLDRNEFNQALADLYVMCGWDEQGVPRRERLAALDIEWAYEAMKR